MLDRTVKAAKPPKTDRWLALENEHHPPTICLLVSGLVQVGRTNLEPRLAEATGGHGPALMLDLTIEPGDYPGTDVLVWKPAHFHTDVSANEYNEVQIRWAGKVIGRCMVLDDDEAHARLTLQTEAANAKTTVKGVAGKAKKAATAVLDAVGKVVSGPRGRAVGTAVAAAIGTAAVAGAATRLMAPAPNSNTTAKTKSAKKTKAKAAPKSKSKAKSKTKAKTKTKAASKKKAAPKKSAKRGTQKTRNVKKARSAKKTRGTKK
jgi:hypothetical protein